MATLVQRIRSVWVLHLDALNGSIGRLIATRLRPQPDKHIIRASFGQDLPNVEIEHVIVDNVLNTLGSRLVGKSRDMNRLLTEQVEEEGLRWEMIEHILQEIDGRRIEVDGIRATQPHQRIVFADIEGSLALFAGVVADAGITTGRRRSLGGHAGQKILRWWRMDGRRRPTTTSFVRRPPDAVVSFYESNLCIF